MPEKPIALTMGDPAGCGPQITAKAWTELRQLSQIPFFIVADPVLYEDLCEVEPIATPQDTPNVFNRALPVLPLDAPLPRKPVLGQPDSHYAPAIIESITRAARLSLSGQAGAMVTNPISKAVLYDAGFNHPGHTEFITSICTEQLGETIKPVMMLVGGGLHVALASIHLPLMQVGTYLTTDVLISIGRTTALALKRDFGIQAPRIAFTGLNPHAGESGAIGREEIDIINPAAASLRAEGIDISDARPGDTVFHETLTGQYDAVIAMTHDQGLIPVKTLDMWGGVNTTLGLPIIRTSPDHGTAYDAAAANICKPDSLLAAIKLAGAMAVNRNRA